VHPPAKTEGKFMDSTQGSTFISVSGFVMTPVDFALTHEKIVSGEASGV
jgi:hypothetical protein